MFFGGLMSTVKIRDIGNSLGVIIPKPYADSLSLKAGKEVTIEMKKGSLIIKPYQYSLEDLVAQMNADNLTPEIHTGEAVGGELMDDDLEMKDVLDDSKTTK